MNPFASDKSESIAAMGELKLLALTRSWLGHATPASPLGMGDDCAVLNLDSKYGNLITVDSVFLGQHFSEDHSAYAIGTKLLKRNISDIAAMGGRPKSAVLALVLPEKLKIAWLKEFYQGIQQTATDYGVSIIGGDLSSAGDTLGGSLTLLGHAEHPMTRSGSQPGDKIYVTGSLGGSILGKHMSFNPRLEEGIWLASHAGVKSMIDVTDGLGKDLPALLQGKLSASIETASIPVSSAAIRLSKEDGKPALFHAVNDGEDYELLFTLGVGFDQRSFEKSFRKFFPTLNLTYLGYCTEGENDSRIYDSTTGEALCYLKGYEYFG